MHLRPRGPKVPGVAKACCRDSERKFEKFIRSIRKINNLSDARRFRSEVASQLKRDSQQEGQDQAYLRRLDMGKRMLDQRVQQLAAAGGDHRALPAQPTASTPNVSKLETADLNELLRDASGLSYFMEYMDRQRLLPLVQFWLVVDGFRNPLENDGDDEQLPLTLPPWTESDRLDLAQIDQAYLSKPELKVRESSKRTVKEFLEAGMPLLRSSTTEPGERFLHAQSAVLDEMRAKHFQNFKRSDLFYKCLASEEASKAAVAPASDAPPLTMPPLSRASQSYAKPYPVPRLATRLQTSGAPPNRRAGSALDLRSHVNGVNGSDSPVASRSSFDEHSPTPLFDDDDVDNEAMADSIQSLDQENLQPPPDTRVVEAVEEALTSIMEDSQPPTVEDLRASLFGNGDASSSIFTGENGSARGSARGSVDLSRAAVQSQKEPDKPSLASLGLVSAASRIGVFEDNDLFEDDDRYLSDGGEDAEEGQPNDEADEVQEAAPGDLGLAEAITKLTNNIDRLAAQEAVVDSLLRKAELTNNTAELRILRKSKASLQREVRRNELQRQQYVVQESDNSLYGALQCADRIHPGWKGG